MPLNAEVEWAFGELAQRGLEEPTVMKTLAGTQSVVSVISAFDPVVGEMKFALKTFAQMYRAQGMVGNEFASLQSFHRALPDSGGIVSPEPLALSTEYGAYLMTYVEGVALDDLLAHGRLRQHETIAKLLAGLRIFHESVGEPYGDFQPANLLIRDAGAVFLDPTVPNPANPAYSASPEMQFAPSSVDLGYWLYSVAVSTPGLLLRHPRLAARRGDFACALAVEAAATIEAAATAHDDSERFIAEVGRVARRHLRWLAQNGGLRDRTLSLLGAMALAQLTRRIVRLSSAR